MESDHIVDLEILRATRSKFELPKLTMVRDLVQKARKKYKREKNVQVVLRDIDTLLDELWIFWTNLSGTPEIGSSSSFGDFWRRGEALISRMDDCLGTDDWHGRHVFRMVFAV